MNSKEKIECIRRQKYFVWGDVVVFTAAFALVLFFFLLSFLTPAAQGNTFSVLYRGEEIFRASLSEDAEYVFYIEDGVGKVSAYGDGESYTDYNVIRVSGGKVSVTRSDCADGTCRHFGQIAKGDILCLPHDLRIRIDGDGLETDV